MAKQVSKPTNDQPKATPILHPQPADPRMELFFLLGVLRGAGVDNSIRIAELVNQLLITAAPAAETGGE